MKKSLRLLALLLLLILLPLHPVLAQQPKTTISSLLPYRHLSLQQSGTAFRFRSGPTLPATCRVGDVFYKTGADAGQYNCTATNTFTIVGGGSSPPFADDTAIIKNAADGTKLIRISAAGITTGTERVWTAPDSNTTIPILSQVITFAGPTAPRTYTLPDSAQTIAGLGVAQTFTANQTFPNTGFRLLDTGADHVTTIKQNSDEAADRTLNIPALGANKTLALIDLAQTFSGNQTFSNLVIVPAGTVGAPSVTTGTTTGLYFNTDLVGFAVGSGTSALTVDRSGSSIRISQINSAGTMIFRLGASAVLNLFGTSVGIGTSTFGTNAASVLQLANGVAPTTSPVDSVALYSADAAAGDANLFVRNEQGRFERLSGLHRTVLTQFDKTTDTTLANITGLTFNVEAGKTYSFEANLFVDGGSGAGAKYAIAGTATATTVIYNVRSVSDGTPPVEVIQQRATALGTGLGDNQSGSLFTKLKGTIIVNGAGTITVQFAQNTSNANTSSVLVGSYFHLFPNGT